MYVCNCNGVTRREVDEAITAGARRAKEVLAHHGCEPCCVRCLPEIAEHVERQCGQACSANVGSLVAAE